MIVGSVNHFREAVVEVTVTGSADQRIAFVVDTGFDGALTLPAATVAELELVPLGIGRAVLGDGSETAFEIREAFVSWDGTIRRVAVDVAETAPLLGMGLVEGHELCVEAVLGGQVRISRLSGARPGPASL